MKLAILARKQTALPVDALRLRRKAFSLPSPSPISSHLNRWLNFHFASFFPFLFFPFPFFFSVYFFLLVFCSLRFNRRRVNRRRTGSASQWRGRCIVSPSRDIFLVENFLLPSFHGIGIFWASERFGGCKYFFVKTQRGRVKIIGTRKMPKTKMKVWGGWWKIQFSTFTVSRLDSGILFSGSVKSLGRLHFLDCAHSIDHSASFNNRPSFYKE